MKIMFIASERRQAEVAVRRARIGPQDWGYVSCVDSIRGLRGYVLVVVGGAMMRQDYPEIIEIARLSDALITIEEDACIRIRAHR